MNKLRNTLLVLTAALAVGTLGATSASASTGNATVHAKTGSHKTNDTIVEGCAFNAPLPFQIVAGGAWYAESHITGCTAPPPESCNLQVELQELVNNESGGQSWQAVSSLEKNITCATGQGFQTNAYKCLSVAFDNEFRTWSQLIVGNGEGGTGVNDATSGTKTIPCE